MFSIVQASACSECGADLARGELLRLERDQPLCMNCADLDQLVFLPRGDAALTRRAGKHSALRAVVVRFTRARKRYERQGILVEEQALEQAEQECLADADARARAKARGAERRAREDAEHMSAFVGRLKELYPGCPAEETAAIAERACARSSGRIGRTAAAKRLGSAALDLAVRAHVRHAHTDYDELLASGWERREARARIEPELDRVLAAWTSGRVDQSGEASLADAEHDR